MKTITTQLTAIAILCAGLASGASAQPRLIITGMGTDLTAGGDGIAGLAYDGEVQQSVPYTWVRGVGYTRVPGAFFRGNGGVYCSSDMQSLAMSARGVNNWGDLNCFRGYDSNGDPRPDDPEPCTPKTISHHWTPATGWVETGSFPRFPDPVTGRMVGGTHCGADINSPRAISRDGRYVLANGWSATAFRANGTITTGLCGDFYPFLYDSLTGNITTFPVQPGSTTARGDRVNADGTVVTGYDLNSAESRRRTVVWRNGVETVLDDYLGAKDNTGVNASGDVLASGASTGFVAATFPGETGVRLVRWTWDSAAWVPENLGQPETPEELVGLPFSDLWVTGISDDGNTIVGNAQYGPPPPTLGGIRRPFIWSPSINGGVPIDLETYITSIDDPMNPIFGGGFTMTYLTAMSADGNAVLVSIYDGRNTCIEPVASLTTFRTGVLYIDGSQIPCDPPRIGLSPKDWNEMSDYNFGSALNVTASGSWPLNYQWQREDAENPGTWNDLTDDCSNFDASNWDYEGTQTVQLRIGQHFGGSGRGGNYRVIVSSPCGSVVSDPATLTHIVGACCIPGNACYIEYESRCATAGGVWGGTDSNCDVDPCTVVACCLPGQICLDTTALDCAAQGGTAGPENQSCFFYVCPTECIADFDHNGSVQVPDIFAFLSAWFSQNPSADVDGTPGITVPDIFAFLSLWFAGCP